MKYTLLTFSLIIFIALTACNSEKSTGNAVQSQKIFCNPMNLSYRFCLDEPSRREAADPVIVLFKEKYFLFASKSGGYWHSDDLYDWNFVTTGDLPLENYAPAAFVYKDFIYFMASTAPLPNTLLYRTDDAINGKWEVVNDSFPINMTDPAFFADDDGRVYFYYGCSNVDPIMAVEVDPDNKFIPVGKPVVCFGGNPLKHGWEQTGDYNEKTNAPWIEGAWMNKYNGKYYLQYAGPGTEFKSYSDGVYISDKPLGPFTLQRSNPFSSKPEGFIAGAGHGATFSDKYGNWWHIATMSISVKHMFERRLGLFPVFFDNDGVMYANTEFGDYPCLMPDKKVNGPEDLFPGWMLLLYKKEGGASASLDGFPAATAFDEDVRSYWSAPSGNNGEWIMTDLGSECTVNAVQVNFAGHNSSLKGRANVRPHKYIIEYSADGSSWKMLTDKSDSEEDLTHPLFMPSAPVRARFVRLTGFQVPAGTLALSGFRIFGKADIPLPDAVNNFTVKRDTSDRRVAVLSWRKSENATGYNIRFGVQNDKLYRTYQVYSDTTCRIRSLNTDEPYWFAIDAFGESGIAGGTIEQSVN